MTLTPMASATTRVENIEGIKHDPRRRNLVNVNRVERLLSIAGGGGLAIYGLRRFDLPGIILSVLGGEFMRRGITGHDYLYQLLDVNSVAENPSNISSLPNRQGIRVSRAMTIERSAHDLYQFWRDVERAPMYMQSVTSVKSTGERTSHWVAQAPTGKTIEWDSEIVEDMPDSLIAWKTTNGVPLAGSGGRVRFTPSWDKEKTVVTSEIDYNQFGGKLGVEFGKIFGHAPEQEVREDLRRFKQLMEAGEIATIARQPVGKGQPLSEGGRKK